MMWFYWLCYSKSILVYPFAHKFLHKIAFFADTWLFFSKVCLSRYNQFALRFANKKSKDGGCLLSVTLALCDTFLVVTPLLVFAR